MLLTVLCTLVEVEGQTKTVSAMGAVGGLLDVQGLILGL